MGAKARKREHCWHPTGFGYSFGMLSGSDNVKCCRCGATSTRHYTRKSEPIKGHGPHVTADTIEYRPITDAGPCAAPPERGGTDGSPGRPTGETET